MNRKESARAIIEDLAKVSRELGRIPSERVYLSSGINGFSKTQIKNYFSSWPTLFRAANITLQKETITEKRDPRVLVWDIETAPILAHVWGMWEQNVGINQIKSDWHLLSWAAKWLHDKTVMYMDQRNAKNIEDDKVLLEGLWKLLDEADCVITQNGKAFDQKKVNARFILNGMKPPSPYKHIDTKQLAKKHFAFTSNKLEYMSEKLCTQKKIKHKEFAGFDLWRECLSGNIKAWKEMELYNKADVAATEELYLRLAPWGTGVDFNPFRGTHKTTCNCGSTEFIRRGYSRTNTGKFQRYRCSGCGAWSTASGKEHNEIQQEKLKALRSRK